jgi:hypothetical protein
MHGPILVHATCMGIAMCNVCIFNVNCHVFLSVIDSYDVQIIPIVGSSN